ncbi:hypothetical protein [Exiguobacterium indicum]|uniref:hypothetical protein n=1 Tax=Exiguobacterium indicum TaxID=296995 RepID=UPI002B25A774|nr:hypothetical protein [Exiguobacterium indicum]
MKKIKNFDTASNATIILIGLAIIILTAVFLYMSPGNFEIIFGIGTVAFVSLGIFVNLQSLAIAQSAQENAQSSADSAQNSVDVAKDALKVASDEAEANAIRYRFEKGPFLTLKKKQFLVPLIAPYSHKAQFDDTERLDAFHNPSALLLTNNGMGTASNISYSFSLLNSIGNLHDYDDLKFESDDVADENAINKSFYLSNHRGFPQYTLTTKLFRNTNSDRPGLLLTCTTDQGNLSEEIHPRRKRSIQKPVTSDEAIQIGYLDNKEGEWIHLPLLFRILSHQYFLERKILKEEHWKIKEPLLELRVDYTDEFSEHMNQFEEARRSKRFLIKCSNDIKVVSEPDDSQHERTGKMLLCRYVIESLDNIPLASRATEQTEEETVDESTGSTEG